MQPKAETLEQVLSDGQQLRWMLVHLPPEERTELRAVIRRKLALRKGRMWAARKWDLSGDKPVQKRLIE